MSHSTPMAVPSHPEVVSHSSSSHQAWSLTSPKGQHPDSTFAHPMELSDALGLGLPPVCAPVPLTGEECPTDHRNFLSSGTQVIWVIVKYTRNLTTHSFIRDITQVPPTFNSNIGSLEIFSSIRKGVLMTVISSFFSPSTLQRLGAQINYYSAENKINWGTNKHRGSLILSNFWGCFSFTLISLISVVGGRAPLLPTFSLF